MSQSLPPSNTPGSGDTPSPGADPSEFLRVEIGALQAILPEVGGGRSDLRESIQAALGRTFVLDRELGGGGMSRVFVATEVALDRRVAVKVLSPELLRGVSAERFAREVSLAARLQDPHIVPVLTTGATADGLPYYTMPFIEGESLRERMRRGPVPLDEALRILRDVAEALEYAHARGIVHRDIKPENVLLSGRNALVADFGIAKAMSAARSSATGGTLTSFGLSLGTPGYMAPEQAAGDTVDHRADVYAWGMVAWELLAGRHPFAPRTEAALLMAAQVTEMPKPLDDVRPGLPPSLGALVMACLAKVPSQRPADAAAILAALGGATTDLAVTSGRRPPVAAQTSRSRLLMVAAAVLALAGAGGWWAARGRAAGGAAAASSTPSLAVLPFEHQGDSADVYLTDGITDEIRNKLTGVSNLLVIARASSLQYKGKNTSPQEIAKELGVRWLLTGTVRVIGTGDQRRVLVRPELVEVTADGRLQSKGGTPFDGPLTDVVKAQGEVASQVVSSMEVAVGGADQAKLVQVATKDPVAYDLYLRGMAAIDGGAANDAIALRRGLALFEQAIERDSTLVEAASRLAISASLLYANVTPLPEVEAKARAMVTHLERVAPGSAEALRTRATVNRNVSGNLDSAIADLERARRLDPNNAGVLGSLALYKADVGRFDDALADFDAAIRLDPRASLTHSSKARVLLRMRRPADARAAAERARALSPTTLGPALTRVMVEVAAGDLAAARRVLEAAKADLSADQLLAYAGTYYELWWVASPADQRRLLTIGPEAYGAPRQLATVRAQVHAALGDRAASRDWADSAVRIFNNELRASPRDPQSHLFQGLLLAYAGRGSDALRSARRGLILLNDRASIRRGGQSVGYFHIVAARAALLAGDREQAIAWLREGLARRSYMNASWIRLDPTFAPLKGDPAFERMLAEAP